MYGADYAWILHYGDNNANTARPWWRSRTADCAAAQVAAAAENVLIVASHNRMVADNDDRSSSSNSDTVFTVATLTQTMKATTKATTMRSLSGLVCCYCVDVFGGGEGGWERGGCWAGDARCG